MATNTQDIDGATVNFWRVAGWGAAALILLLPLVAMQFTEEVNWNVGDFVIAAVLLGGVGLTFELAVRKSGNTAYRYGVGLALVAALLLIWVNGAVGIIGSENNDANLMYGGVLAIAFIGAVLSRFRAKGMAIAMFAAAAAQVLVGVIALAGNLGTDGNSWPWDVVGATAVFTALWVGSAILFRRAAAAS